ncbi:preprotein translocase subunit SecE [Tessaracoccus antarcticus]|uniref:preprotein translocase subunit SecE n=1 Tax=Tessaracoccus antarcticus TaxID=2479848 RepID=UPI001314B930|nr:preprotein translocase subunit SecE [Tessaracoccus antarcticus]
MSDKTPDSTGASDREYDALGDSSVDPIEADAVDEVSEPTDATPSLGATRRRSSNAPVRRGTVGLDQDADDDTIAELEDGFTEDEQNAASSARRRGNAPVRKTTATRKRSESQKVENDPYSASNPATFVKQSASEIKKVVWPTWPQLTVLFVSVLIFVLFMIAFVGALDLLFGWGLLAMFGDS